MAAALPPRTDSALPQPRPNPTRATSARTASAKVHLMASLTVPNPGQAIIAFHKAQMHAESRHQKMQSCRSCSKEEAEQWKRDAELFANLIQQIKEQ